MIKDIIVALMSKVGEVRGIRQAYTWEPDDFSADSAWPVIERITYHQASDNGVTELRVMVIVTVGRQNAQEAVNRWYTLLGIDSVKAKIEEDSTLAGKALDVTVMEASVGNIGVGDSIYPAVIYELLILF